LKTRDEAARRRARRKYVRTILNDFVMNPGPSLAAIRAEEEAKKASDRQDEGDDRDDRRERAVGFGLMGSFVERWASRMPAALALGAGEHIKLPPGNNELIKILEPFDK
jgi:hypothetical protein